MANDWMETSYGRFSADFCVDLLANLCHPNAGIQTGPFGSQLHQEDYVQIGTPIITVEHLGENRILHINTPKVSDSDRSRLARYQLTQGDIVFSRVGSVDRRALVREKEEGWLFSGRCLRVRPDPNKIDSQYLSYFFGLSAFKEHIRSIAVGATMPSLNTSLLSEIAVPHPPNIEEQRAIAHILGTLDDKIELNRRANETLEAMARTLFKAWFVDFEPVRAKIEGRWQRGQSLPGLPAHLYDIFPERLVESELGEIPEGWHKGSLGEVAVHPRRSVKPGEIKDETPYIALEHMPKRCIALAEWGVANGLESNKYEFKRGEILFGKLRPYFYKVGVAPINGVCSTDIVVIAPKLPIWFGFVLAHASSDAFVEYTNAGSTGTKMPRTSWTEMARYTVVLPHEDVAAAFNQHVQAASEEITANIHESKSLAELRNTLLPKLISGELRVPDAERIVGSTV